MDINSDWLSMVIEGFSISIIVGVLIMAIFGMGRDWGK